MKTNETLEQRIRRIAANMEGNFVKIDGIAVPHSVFVEWDQTWTLFEGEDDRWVYATDWDKEYYVTPNSSDAEIEEAIRDWESGHQEYYWDDALSYIDEHKTTNKRG